jgi:DNA-binding transcriptional LysR family regulator
MLSLGRESLAAYAKADGHGHPLFRLPAPEGASVPFLGYADGAYLGRLVQQIVKQAADATVLDPTFETDMAEGLKAMALEGHGLAFLPASSVRKELASGLLVKATRDPGYELTMDVRIYRERPDMARHSKPAAQALWAFLESQGRGEVPAD